jgi:hypothetical protein
MTKHKQIDQCVDIIVYTMENHPHSNKIEAILRITFTTMSIFLSDKDMIDMINNKITPKLSENAQALTLTIAMNRQKNLLRHYKKQKCGLSPQIIVNTVF